MTMTGKLGLVLVTGITGFLALESERLSPLVRLEVISTAEARVGRPLTPVSVAGVARRTVRRCAVGVYSC
jgi:hypothetical protein